MLSNQLKKRWLPLQFLVSKKKKIVYSTELDALSKIIKKQSFFFFKSFCCCVSFNHFNTSKGAGVRIGKGKGSFNCKAFAVFIGSPVYFFKTVYSFKAVSFFFQHRSSFKGLLKNNFKICK